MALFQSDNLRCIFQGFKISGLEGVHYIKWDTLGLFLSKLVTGHHNNDDSKIFIS